MVMSHMSYVSCDNCGTPASDVVGNATEARRMVPVSWTRFFDASRNRRVDWCGACSNAIPGEVDESP